MMDLHAAVDFLGEEISLEQAIDRVQSLAEERVAEPWFLGYGLFGPFTGLPLTTPHKSFDRLLRNFSHEHSLVRVTNSDTDETDGYLFYFNDDDPDENCLIKGMCLCVYPISKEAATEILRVWKKYRKYSQSDFIRSDDLWYGYLDELYAPIRNVAPIGQSA